ncbi:MAG: hypothetical protein LBI35_05690 [Burkholderiales bacterium]|nr:hypothetical protein [Burkholderiales bacterium]
MSEFEKAQLSPQPPESAMDETKKPTPGSNEAVEAGCTCAIFDNHYGRGYGGDGEKFGWIMNENCPLHGEKERK